MRQTLRRHRLALAVVVAGLGLVAPLIVGAAQTRTSDPAARDWIQLFNGRDLADWTIKFAKHDPGVNLFVALDAARGVPLWRAGLHASNSNGPVSYQLDGVQYVVVAANDTLYAFSSGARR
jgi:hypothetical protein